MKESVFDVLIYLFESYLENDEDDAFSCQDSLEELLLEAGFPSSEIDRAFKWLETLVDFSAREGDVNQSGDTIRLYTTDESRKINASSKGLLLTLEENRIIDFYLRELIIERVMALEMDSISEEQFKWVVMMVLLNRPESDEAITWLVDSGSPDGQITFH